MFHAVAFSLLSVGCFYLAVSHQGGTWLLAWVALSFIVIAAAYATNKPALLGKQPDGDFHIAAMYALAPFLLFAWIIWNTSRVVTLAPAFAELIPGVYVGRRLLLHEVPPDVRTIIDLTAELPGTTSMDKRWDYVNIPILDGTAGSPEQIINAVTLILQQSGPVLIHCAQGHGRTGLIAAALLLAKDPTLSPEQAILLTQAKRAGIALNRPQKMALEKLALQLRTLKS